MAGSVIVVGSINGDLSVRLDRMPRPGETRLGQGGDFSIGGKGFNQAVAARRAGAEVALVGAVGDDDIGRAALRRLAEEGVGTEAVARRGDASGMAAIMVDEGGENAIAVAPNANLMLAPCDLSGLDFRKHAVLVVQGEMAFETTRAALDAGRAAGLVTVLNPAPAAAAMTDLLPLADIVTPNLEELTLLSGRGGNVAEMAEAALERGATDLVVTLGREGCAHASRNGFVPYAAFPVSAVDTTGAGDVFTGTLAAALAQGSGMTAAITRAQAAAALSVTQATANAAPRADEVTAFLSAQGRRP